MATCPAWPQHKGPIEHLCCDCMPAAATVGVDETTGEIDVAYVRLTDRRIVETVQQITAVNIDYDRRGRIVGIEIL